MTTAAKSAPSAVLELRQYTLVPGERETLISLFEREFIEPQEAEGMRLVGQFRDVERDDRFVWIRGFADMPSRDRALRAFYGGPVWRAHRERANATMLDSSDVLLLRPVDERSGFDPRDPRPELGASETDSSSWTVTLAHLVAPADAELLRLFDERVRPSLGARLRAVLVTEAAENTFPALPVREGEHVLVWIVRSDANRDEDWAGWSSALASQLRRPLERLTLAPTLRSALR